MDPLTLVIILAILLFIGGGYGYHRYNGWAFGSPDLIGLLVFIVVILLIVKLIQSMRK
jgi:hypothetical protein